MLQQILEEDCYMLDIESTGLSPIINGMTSFCLVKFDVFAGSLRASILDYVHHRINTSINVDMYRTNDPETMQFRRSTNIGIIEAGLPCIDRHADIAINIECFLTGTNINNRNIFALHTEFDVAFLKGYYEASGKEFPFKHRNVWELASLIAGLNQDLKEIREAVKLTEDLNQVGGYYSLGDFQPHNAFYDCIRQIAFLRMALAQSGNV